jgi:hypothetical protein
LKDNTLWVNSHPTVAMQTIFKVADASAIYSLVTKPIGEMMIKTASRPIALPVNMDVTVTAR